MLQSGWLFVGLIAILATAAAVLTTDDAIAIVGGALGFISWGIWTFGSLDVEVVSEGQTLTFTHPELALLGVALALIPGYIALTGPVEIVSRARDPRVEDL